DDGATAVRHFINIADAGLGGDVAFQMGNGTKRFGTAAYKIAAGRALLGYKNKPMTVNIDGSTHELPKAQQVVVANCQLFGGGMRIPTLGVRVPSRIDRIRNSARSRGDTGTPDPEASGMGGHALRDGGNTIDVGSAGDAGLGVVYAQMASVAGDLVAIVWVGG